MRYNLCKLGITLILVVPVFGQVTFIDRASELGIVHQEDSRGVGIIDLDNDGVCEIIMTSNRGADRLYIRQDSIYVECGAQYGLAQNSDYHHAISLTDIDKDFLPDFYITGAFGYGNHGHLYLNRGHPPFIDIAESYNLSEVREMGSAFFQFMPESELAVLSGGLLMVRQEQTFIDITQGSGFETITNVLTPVFFDIDGDNDDDLFVGGNHTENDGRLFRNNGDTTFTDISYNTNEGGMPLGQSAAIGDIDNDGDFDIYMTAGYDNPNYMWENDGTGYFTNITAQSNTGIGGYTRGAVFGDFDNDCDIDIFVNRAQDYNVLFLNNGQGVFTDYSLEAGVMDYLNGVGCATGDLDNDGQLDIVSVNCNSDPAQVYINQNQDNSFLKIKLIGLYPNTLALGAIVDLYGITTEPHRVIYIGKREVQSASSVYSFNDPVIHFGTGLYESLKIVVTFNSLAVYDTSGVLPGSMLTIYEDWVVSADDHLPELPSEYAIIDAYPNPFNSSVNITVSGSDNNDLGLTIYDILGREVKSARFKTDGSARPTYIWDGMDNQDRAVPSGVYFVKLNNSDPNTIKKITLLK
jgi:hypothetical protein